MLKAIMVGAGQRGYEVYGVYAKEHPADLQFVAVAEPQPARRKRFAEEHEINESRQYEDWHESAENGRLRLYLYPGQNAHGANPGRIKSRLSCCFRKANGSHCC